MTQAFRRVSRPSRRKPRFRPKCPSISHTGALAAFADGDEAERMEFRRRATRDALLDVEWGDE